MYEAGSGIYKTAARTGEGKMSSEKMFRGIEKSLLLDKRPSQYLEKAGRTEMFHQPPFQLLDRLKKTKQSSQYHPEGSVWIHTMMVVDVAAELRIDSRNPRVFMWAALLHDIGKPSTTRIRRGRITSYNHDLAGEKLTREFLEALTKDEEFIAAVCGLVRYHMQILYVLKGMDQEKLKEMKSRVDIREAALLGFCDRMGRGGADKEMEKENIKKFLLACGMPEIFSSYEHVRQLN